MRPLAAAAAGLMLAATGALPARAATVEVVVEGLRNATGQILVAVCPESLFLGRECPWVSRVPARGQSIVARLEGVPPGIYAIQAIHDENANMDLDRNFVGYPLEGLGFSNDAPIRFGPPRFGDAAVTVRDPETRARLTLRYF
ncbi:DUF2141 domain-containing protein [Arenibaculum pallidiluteum]|uniref:DUF2141 domain-containing protein n=1 Tax=Arenibaculum pallidiluteum TaxID=2812559 RepID=UPI001A9650FE|nr:DUF2141 domain-containing protein [Arenibaculum pallidiluteum]